MVIQISSIHHSPSDPTSNVFRGQLRDVGGAHHRHGSYTETNNESTSVEHGKISRGGRHDCSTDEERNTVDDQTKLSADSGGKGRGEDGSKEAKGVSTCGQL
jgi:hypothetical protein